MVEKKRVVLDVRKELGDLLERLLRDSEDVDRFLKSAERAKKVKIIEYVARRIRKIKRSVPAIYERSEELFKCAITDGLTNLLNRGYFEDVIKPGIEEEKQTAIIMTDIDHFGKYNGRYSHVQGDEAIKFVAKKVSENANTDLIARYGGEEFSIILARYRNKGQDVRAVAENIRKSVEQATVPVFSIDSMVVQTPYPEAIKRKMKRFLHTNLSAEEYEAVLHSFFPRETAVRNYVEGLQRITISVGAAERNEDESATDLIYRADKALYRAKDAGRNCVRFDGTFK